jgi:hypothetical protein
MSDPYSPELYPRTGHIRKGFIYSPRDIVISFLSVFFAGIGDTILGIVLYNNW